MRKQFWTLFLAVVFLLAGMDLAVAQSHASLSFKVAFPFKIGETTLPAGSYKLTYTGATTHNLQLINKDTGATQFVRYITRLSPRTEGNVVFDSYQNQRYLSEVYLGGSDGFQIQSTPQEHNHELALKSQNP